MKELNEIKDDIKKNDLKPLYVLDGEEPYYIDLISDYLEQHVLEPHEKDFNFSVFYGKDTNWSALVNECRSYPAFANRRLVILKEAGQMKDFALLESYFQNPSATTVLVIAYKYKKIDGRLNALKQIKKNGRYYTFEKLKEHKISEWIIGYGKSIDRKISDRNAELLAAYLGTDLQKIANEIDKASINLKPQEEISEDIIEKYIGISKDYNIFQYPSAILERNMEKAFKIANYFIANSKDFHMTVVTATVYGQFAKLYTYHYAVNLPASEIASRLKIPPFFIKEYEQAARKYNLHQTKQAIHLLMEYNLNGLGVNVAKNDLSLLKEMTAKLINL